MIEATTATHAIWPSITDTRSAARSLLLQLGAGAALGIVVFYGVAFAESPFAHNAAHDVRHMTVQPCH